MGGRRRLAPLGFLAAIATRQHAGAILLVLPLVFLLWLLARDRNQRIEQAHQRLKLVEQERVRLQSAVRRLGDAFAAKLELGGLLDILLHGSIEALDAGGGTARADRRTLARASVGRRRGLARRPWNDERPRPGVDAPVQVGHAGVLAAERADAHRRRPREIGGSLWLVRAARPFEDDEIALISELVAKAELAAAEIIAHHAIREQAMTDPLTGLGNRRNWPPTSRAAFEEHADGTPSVLLLFDLDGFKPYNDTFGHQAGDELLARVGQRLRRAVDGVRPRLPPGRRRVLRALDLAGADAGRGDGRAPRSR